MLYVLAMVAVIVAVDVLFLRDYTLARLIVNVLIAAVFVAGYFLLVK